MRKEGEEAVPETRVREKEAVTTLAHARGERTEHDEEVRTAPPWLGSLTTHPRFKLRKTSLYLF